MADTYKDKLKYKYKHVYKLCKHSWPVPCNKECPAFNFPWYKVPRDRDVKYWRTALWHSFKQKVKKEMYKENYDNLPVRPYRYAWIID